MAEYFVEISVPVESMEFWRELNGFMDRTFGSAESAGTGFGFRDFQYDVKSEGEGEFLVARMKRELAQEYGPALVSQSDFQVHRRDW